MAVPARKVFWEAVPVVEVAAQVLRDRASSVLRRVNAAFTFSLTSNTKNRIPYRTIANNRYIAVGGHFVRRGSVEVQEKFKKEMSGLRSLLDSTLHEIRVLSTLTAIPLAGVLRGSDCTR